MRRKSNELSVFEKPPLSETSSKVADRRSRAPVMLTVIVALATLSGCDRDPLTGPPELRLGRDECAECGMIINEDRCSSALLIDSDGERRHALFDDIGCMVDFEGEKKSEVTVHDRFVHDYNTRAWIDATTASILFTDPEKIITPMGSGIVALRDQTSADALRSAVGGEIMNYTAGAAARSQWKKSRFGRTPERPAQSPP